MNTAISVEQLSKEYQLGVIGTGTLTRDLNKWWARLRGKPDPYARIGEADQSNLVGDSILALANVSFTVQQGEVLGIIGRNGAGKSTLLKILSQVTAPTQGKVKIKGRVGSLLEVGTGFHPELTGRENVYLNGAILGMTRDEVDGKFDEIVDFSGVEKFIDTPVKRYSSGMYVRLAFAVAAHLDPEILIVDEVLAVGDAEFQKKCLGKMGEVATEGRTVLFVSHNMQAIKKLCSKSVLIEGGKIEIIGKTKDVIERYFQNPSKAEALVSIDQTIDSLPFDPVFKLVGVKIFQNDDENPQMFMNSEPIKIEIRYRLIKDIDQLRVYIDLCDDENNLLLRSFHDERSMSRESNRVGEYLSIVTIPENLLGPINYVIWVRASIHNVRNCLKGIRIPLRIENTGLYNFRYPSDTFRGKLAIPLNWETKNIGGFF